ncbi:phosphomevalonate kinase isoform X1 [Electrophorus electricus]|uniref:phosphomevalonate kinase isoform X1 n=1 Tax=Electrophorus electricus TaxID=8005 RepID=UPI000F0A08A9|nr:phosphomevalonate kinase isoform X1 [Electrophorus electricus]
MTTLQPKLILLFSGKRKSGKDYVTDLIQKSFARIHRFCRLGPDLCRTLTLSGPLKERYAHERGLDYEQLLGAGPYKEEYRADMIRWGESRRQQDPGVFCRLAVSAVTRPVWVVSDCRRMSDLQWFWTEYPQQCVSVRVEASERTRALRGWRFTAGVDDAESECGLDQGVDFDWILTNNGDANLLDQQLEGLLSLIKAKTQDSRDGIHQRGE